MSYFNSNLFCLNSEQLLLGCLLTENNLFKKISNILNKRDFFFKNHEIIYSVILSFNNFEKNFDLFILSNKIKNFLLLDDFKIINYLEILKKKAFNNLNICDYATIIHNLFILRKLSFNASNIIKKITFNKNNNINILLKKIENNVLKLNKNFNNIYFNIPIISDIFEKVFYKSGLIINNNNNISGLSTGFIDLDNILSGLHKGELIIIAGRPSMGKTAFAINIAQNISLNFNLPVIIFSMEMSNEQLATRLLSSISQINQNNIKRGNLSFLEFSKLKNIILNLNSVKIFIDENVNLTPLDIFSKSKSVLNKYGCLGLIIIDYLQLMNSSSPNKNRVMEISEISRNLKCLAKDLDVPIIAISQLNRSLENRVDKRPIMSDLRESGAIEQDADIILFVYRDEIYDNFSNNKGIAEILISKQRNGPTGVINLLFSSDNLKFSNYIYL
ncbi:Replicative DNA helicase [Candidatus Nasuia deltocephalinicola]|nr:Replicative DNA helicase [Candidatus Nasuia deltocephalinicola]